MFKDRWVQRDGYLATKDDSKHGNGAFIFEEDGNLRVMVYRYLSDRIITSGTYKNFPETVDEAKLLAEDYIAQLMEIGE